MLRPERMSRVSVTGSKAVMADVIETVHELDLLHITEYDGSFDGFEPGNPTEGADQASDKLVTVRALESTLGIEPGDAGPTRLVTDEALEEELEEIRQEVNELDDRREELEHDLREVEDGIDRMEFFVRLGIDLDLLKGYESLSVAVGEGDPDGLRKALADADAIEAFEVFAEGSTLAAFAYPADEQALDDALVGAEFTAVELPDGEGDPETYLEEIHHRRQQLESQLSTVENELEELKLDVAGFLLAAEEKLTIEVQKREAPLTFATTDNAFVAEGWIPTDEVADFEAALRDTVGEHVDIDELERADYDGDGHPTESEPVPEATPDADDDEAAEVAADGGESTAATDGGTSGILPMSTGMPPVVQENPGSVRPFESLVEVINRPKYTEIDPTVALFLTFPLFFGFMIGDLGYGILYFLLGYVIYSRMESDVLRSLGGVGMWAGGFTALFGVLYGEFFGLHQLGEIVWNGHPPIHKGLQPHYIVFAQAWLLASIVAGIVHLIGGRVLDFINNVHHGVGEAFIESGSWIMLTAGIWLWVFSTEARGPKPDFMFTVFSSGEAAALPLGFTGFSPTVGTAGLVMTGVGLALAIYAEGGIALVESITQAFGHVVSYTRLAAVLLAKAGMALVVNLLVFGATLHGGEFHFIFFMESAPNPEYVVFSGLVNGSGPVMLVLGWLAGIIVLVLGHLVVLLLGVSSAGLQGVRLEYVEFFGKFYEGGGTAYRPFGHEREYTAGD
ncbi:V-type ATP synthase subunit I [Halorhabdus sp. CBA1104]|uniref:V-type ATP synthase subunit I n=1 Tax=Halorhabdus sp. CBA1104 TaxID=1380432 RepID=UPI0012B3B370|nr:V-type ATP synthase subunit I [Halorhabdus sp. CBA1104]QGN05897.1 V-type ATP synthase subunit I [Halorhabdus sp. CBA1104]